MPPKPLKNCNSPGCLNLTRNRICDECQAKRRKEANARRTDQNGFIHSRKWRAIRELKLATTPFCERCDAPATHVHHKDRNQQNNKPSNLESMCHACHEEEHKDERFGKKGS